MTLVVNLFGGPGVGKSTTAAELFSDLKKIKISCELVREYVKDWAWEERRIDPLNQLHLLGEQSYRESILYGKVSVVVTDSPLILCGFYQEYYSQQNYLTNTIKAFMAHAHEHSKVRYLNIILSRKKEYDPKGRYETEEQAIEIDRKLSCYTQNNFSNYSLVYKDGDNYDSIYDEVIANLLPK